MHCPHCKKEHEPEASYCGECGAALSPAEATTPRKNRRSYFIALLFVPALLIAGAIGYYKYFLPQGVAAVVNGEEIRMSELDAGVRRVAPSDAAAGQVRYRVLSQLITERLILQEAVKAGMTVSDQEVAAAAVDTRSASGMDEPAFKKDIEQRYGGSAAFQDLLRRRLLMNKFIAAKVIPADADPQIAQVAFARWLDGVSGRANVRVAMEEQGPGAGAGCGGACCNKGGGGAGNRIEAAQTAALAYWKGRHGQDAVTARATDLGCHIQVDILKDRKRVASLRYQDGAITEL